MSASVRFVARAADLPRRAFSAVECLVALTLVRECQMVRCVCVCVCVCVREGGLALATSSHTSEVIADPSKREQVASCKVACLKSRFRDRVERFDTNGNGFT